MTTRTIALSLDSDFINKLRKKSVKQGYRDIHQYIEEVLRRQIYWNRKRVKKKDAESEYLDKFSKPTKETYKIMRSIQPR